VTAAFCTLERGGKACYLCFLLQPEKGLLKTLTNAGKSLYSTKFISWVLSRVANDGLLHVYKSLHDVRKVEAQCDAGSTKRR
jgi:hypothetical protein